MARLPFNILVYAFCKTDDRDYRYLLLKRTDNGCWQGIAGGGENHENPVATAKREICEETGLHIDSTLYQLSTVAPVPANQFPDSYLWGDDLFVIPQYYFGVEVDDKGITLSPEHADYCWTPCPDAMTLLKFDNDKTALWELDRKLRGLGPRD